MTFTTGPSTITPGRFEFIGGPLNTELRHVPIGDDGQPLAIVYVEIGRPTHKNYPQRSPDNLNGAWVEYRFVHNKARLYSSTYHLVGPDRPAGPDMGQMTVQQIRDMNYQKFRARMKARSAAPSPAEPLTQRVHIPDQLRRHDRSDNVDLA